MKAAVLQRKGKITIEDVAEPGRPGVGEVKIAIKACGICGSDIHYYKEGAIGEYVVRSPMILGHEASGIVTEIGEQVHDLKVGDRICMEPGIPDFTSEETLRGIYNLDPAVRFWATPPIDGCLCEQVLHPARFCFPLPDSMDFDQGALIEPLSIGIEAATKAAIEPGNTALVVGCGTIGIMVALSAIAGGCSKVFVTDVKQRKLDIAASYGSIVPINTAKEDMEQIVFEQTGGKGVDRIFEASGSPAVYPHFFRCARRGARAVLVGMMNGTVPIDVSYLQNHGISIETVFRYANRFEEAVGLVASNKIDVRPLISKRFSFDRSIEAYDYAAAGHEDTVKVVIDLP